MTASLRHLLVLVHLRILNWLVVNSPGTMEQRIIPDTYTEVPLISSFYELELWKKEPITRYQQQLGLLQDSS
ncbi:hypothetical protein V6N11_028843 [Hibiscus sabdariffa]|uniref:Uncharacterized protein n=2 Tax=Hibiscus sabdariffa TaxID=183260 RepID=A0ABR2AJ75_9ROSI